jgi:Fis family transcriptional regulator
VIATVERSMLAAILHRAGGNQTQAADMLGVNRNTLRTKLCKYGIR